MTTSKNPPSCSAVLVNYNHSATLSNALDAALNQTLPFDEIIIVDDASTNDSVEVISNKIQGVDRARLVVHEVNRGVVEAINTGMREAKGDFIFILSADDSYSLHIMEWFRAALKQYPDVAMMSGNVRVCNTESGLKRKFILPFPQQVARYSRADVEAVAQKRAFTFYGGANVIRRDAMVDAGGHVAALKWHADWFLYLLIACRYPFAVVPHEFIRIRQASDQYSHACYDWKKQKPVIAAFIRMLSEDYPVEYGFFRNGGLLPTYDIQALFLLLTDNTLRHYLTPLLAWRLLTYKPMRAIGRLLPEELRPRIRAWLKL